MARTCFRGVAGLELPRTQAQGRCKGIACGPFIENKRNIVTLAILTFVSLASVPNHRTVQSGE